MLVITFNILRKTTGIDFFWFLHSIIRLVIQFHNQISPLPNPFDDYNIDVDKQ